METNLKKRIPPNRTFEQLRNHYQVEKAIATRLKSANREERQVIYKQMYEELYSQVPDHPRLQRSNDRNSAKITNTSKLRLVERFVNKSTTLVEFGPGDCSFLLNVCKQVHLAYGVDISDQRKQIRSLPSNFQLVVYDGYSLGLKESSVDVVFSDQVIEHFHPEDTELHFALVSRLLKPGGLYIFRTPHRFTGPHDVSGYFSDEAEGFHLREWTYSEIAQILKKFLYSSWWGYWCLKGIHLKLPFAYFTAVERLLSSFPRRIRKPLSKTFVPTITIAALK
jgi:SAM-dependent methyltransferase